MAIQRHPMRLQHRSGLAAGKIDPEHLRVVLKIVDIAALFLRAVQHHMTRCYHMLGIIKPEVRLARSDIKQLIRIFIIPRNSWQAGVLFQSACSAGIHCKRCSTAAVRSLAAVDGTKIDIHLCWLGKTGAPIFYVDCIILSTIVQVQLAKPYCFVILLL